MTSFALRLVSSIFFQVFISSYLRRAILFANNYASLSTLFKISQTKHKDENDVCNLLFSFFFCLICRFLITLTHGVE